eukprot:1686676-Pyramimonas_sp.AAC.1
MADRRLECRSCETQFVFTAKMQQWIQSKGYSEPSRCEPCRAVAREYHNDISRSYAERRAWPTCPKAPFGATGAAIHATRR